MDLGRIYKHSGEIHLGQWSKVIAKHKQLKQAPDRKGTNPFTNEEVVFPGEGIAFYYENGKKSGNISLQNGVLLTTGGSNVFLF